VIHLALHGYVDPEIPDRSALVFAPQQQATDDGLLQIREIRNLHLNASLVTLSACNTGVGPVGEEGIANIVNAFIEAGSQSVVSTLWELEDHATAHLMTVFYNHLGHTEEKAEALRQAQLENAEFRSAAVLLGGLCARRRSPQQPLPSAKGQSHFKEFQMTVGHSSHTAPPQLSIRDRHAILDKVLATMEKRFYRPEKLDDDWRAAVNRHRH